MFYLERISHIALRENDNPTASSKYILKAFFPKLQDVTGLFKMRMCLKIKIIIKKKWGYDREKFWSTCYHANEKHKKNKGCHLNIFHNKSQAKSQDKEQ